MKYLKIALLTLLVIVAVAFVLNYPKFKIISGFTAKNMASSYFLAKRSVKITNETDNNGPLTKYATAAVDKLTKTVHATVFGLSPKKAIYRPGLGATLINNSTVVSENYNVPNRNFTPIQLPYPYGNLAPKTAVFNHVDTEKIDSVVANCFVENYPDVDKNTRAVVVLYKGNLIAEHYAKEFDENSLLQGWSITKSLLTTCFGVLEKEKDYHIDAPITAFESWQKDERKNITTNHLLRMESGLEWEENYNTICDVTKMLFQDEDCTVRPLEKLQIQPAEIVMNYSSGTSNVLSALLRKQFKTHQQYLNYPYQSFIDRIGMHSMVLETDINGNYVGSSYSWATARDWAKFGQLFLDKGVWNGEQVLSENWVKYVQTPSKTSKGEYGGQWWLNQGDFMPNVPKDCYYADGFQGQRIFVIPSKDLVVVRFGVSSAARVGFYPLFNDLLGTICSAIH